MIEINQLRLSATQPRVAQPHRSGLPPMPTFRRAVRPLTVDEEFILSHVQDIYGSYNQAKRVDFDENGKASISAVDRKHQPVILVNLTDIGKSYSDGTIKSVDDLRRNWLYSNDP